jgi:glycosyltransferase involved in cell wall biosynthesis
MTKKAILYIEFLQATAANHLLMMIKGLSELDRYTIVVLCQKNSYLATQLKFSGIKHVYAIDYVQLNTRLPSTYIPCVKTIFLVLFLVAKHNIRIIHCHWLKWAYLGIIPSLLLRVPLVIHIVVIEKLTNNLDNLLFRLHQKIIFIAVSKNAKEQFVRLYNIPSQRVKVHYGGVYFPDIWTNRKIKINTFEKLIKNKKIIIGMISRMDPLKGVDIFIRTAGILIDKYPTLQFYFIHIGNQTQHVYKKEYKEQCIRLVKKLNINNRFMFVDYIDNVLPYYKYFFALIVPTFKDALSYVNIEAYANKIPVIFTHVDGVNETTYAKSRYSIPYPPSPIDIEERLIHLIRNPKEYKEIQKKVFNFSKKYFDSVKNASNLADIYKSLTKSHSP